MKDWNELSMAEKADIMKLAVEGGVYDLDSIRSGYNEYAKGGKIHIKPENRGKFTALKKRTGHSATWFKEHGTPAQKKMATFAINAAKWKHEYGGSLYAHGGELGNYYDGWGDAWNFIKRGWNKVKDAVQASAVYDNPAVMTAAGWRINNGKAIQDRQNDAGVKQLRENLATIGDAGLAAPTLVGDMDAALQVARHPIKTAKSIKNGIVSTSKAVRNGLSELVSKGERALKDSGLGLNSETITETQKAAELGRQDFIEDIGSDWNRKRWENATSLSSEDIDRIIGDMKAAAEEVPFDYSKTAEQLSGKEGFVTWGDSSPRPRIEYKAADGRPVYDYNTGLDVRIASDRGSKARNTGYHELLHYTTDNAKGIHTKYAKPIYNGTFEPIGLDYVDDIMIPRGKAWQHFVMEQNESLLPKMDSIYESVINNPQEVEKILVNMGRTPEAAKKQVQMLRDDIQDLDDIQEIRAHLKTWFKSDVMPYLKDPNNASEIESVLEEVPDILENRPDKVKRIMETVRPGSLSDYSKYLAESLGLLPFVYNNSKSK